MAKTIKPPHVKNKPNNNSNTTPPEVKTASTVIKTNKPNNAKVHETKITTTTRKTKNKKFSLSVIIGIILMVLGLALLGYTIYKFVFPLIPPIPTKVEAPKLEMNPVTVTNNQTIDLKGTTTNTDKNIEYVKIAIDDDYKLTVSPDENGDFSQQITFGEANKEYHLKTYGVYTKYNVRFKTQESYDYVIIYDNTPPKIELPEFPTTTRSSQITIHGKIDEDSTITIEINGKEETFKLSAGEEFDKDINLKKGTNTITFTVKDEAGNTTTKGPYKIVYRPKDSHPTQTSNSTNATTNSTLPKSDGIFDLASNKIFTNIILKALSIFLVLGYISSLSISWLNNTYKNQK